MADFVIPFEQLPERFAENVRHPPPVPVAPRPAATIALMRDGDEGVEILLLRRVRTAGFVPGAYVFPGGRVDRSDAEDEVVRHLDGLDAGSAAARLGLAGADPPALAYYLAAVREAFEETGILVASGADGRAPPTAAEDPGVDALRADLMGDRITFARVLERMGCRLDGGAVEYLAHWITPEPEPRRYDTRFFAAKVRTGALAVVDEREMTDAAWLAPAEALRRHRAGRLPMVFPTIRTLQDLVRFRSVDEVLAELRTRVVPTILPRLVLTPTGIGMETDP
jgi:8-oxo-dGTP pyrophosphatase MutT (NUDIX family)